MGSVKRGLKTNPISSEPEYTDTNKAIQESLIIDRLIGQTCGSREAPVPRSTLVGGGTSVLPVEHST